MEDMDLSAPGRTPAVDPGFWRGKRVFITGHTGFKGSWLSLWLHNVGAQVHGYALPPPTNPALFDEAGVLGCLAHTVGDVRDLGALRAAMAAAQPECIIHMAAQPLVRLSYAEPVNTYAINVMGTVNVLEAVRSIPGVRAVVNVTTDKCYDNRDWLWGYRESDALGGHDPYSSSKACAELVTAAYRRSFFQQGGPAIATARAGNVIGGGDWAADRLLPDVLRAFERGQAVHIRHPHATRPWQHVLEPLAGYLMLAQALCTQGHAVAEAWNFGPADADVRPVHWIVEALVQRWGSGAAWRMDDSAGPHEARQLRLDSASARARLGWQPRWPLEQALHHVVDWHQAWLRGDDMQRVCLEQIDRYSQAMTTSSP